MNLIFKNSGPIDGFVQWLKNFSTITQSLLIEVDTNEKKFVSKTFTPDKGLVRYSEISFEQAGLVLESDQKLENRLKLGIFLVLQRFIQICELFSGTDFEFIVNYEQSTDEDSSEEFISDSITLKSKSLTMRVDEASVNEFTYLNDDVFNNSIHAVEAPTQITISPEMVKNLIAISGIYAEGAKKDFMIFYSKKKGDGYSIVVRDKLSNYEYELGEYVPTGKFEEFSATIFREKFLLALKGLSEDLNLIMSSLNPSRILFDTVSETTKTVISIVNE